MSPQQLSVQLEMFLVGSTATAFTCMGALKLRISLRGNQRICILQALIDPPPDWCNANTQWQQILVPYGQNKCTSANLLLTIYLCRENLIPVIHIRRDYYR